MAPAVTPSAVNRPGVIYRIDPATGKASVFFDLNTVLSQIDPNALATDGKNPAANSLGTSTGYVNWYDIAFDPEGNFDGSPTMFVASADRSDPSKNAIYMISPSGQFLGAFVLMTDGLAATKFNINPTGMVIPGPEDQAFLRGLLAGSGISTTGGTFAGLFFNANAYSPGQTISNSTLPTGVSQTGLTLGTIVGMTEANADYFSPVYSAFTDFGTPAAGGIPATPGDSGVQGSNGELLIGSVVPATTTSLTIDQTGAVSTDLRRFEDIAFDHYGYFSQDIPLTSTTTTSTTPTVASTTAFTVTLPPVSAGNLFVSDLASGLSDDCHPDIDRRGHHTGGRVGDSHRPRRGADDRRAPVAKSQPTVQRDHQSSGRVLPARERQPSPGRPDYPDHAPRGRQRLRPGF